jgi:hypothetical protein
MGTPAELFQTKAEACNVCLPCDLGCQLLLLSGESLLSLFEVMASAAVLLKADRISR